MTAIAEKVIGTYIETVTELKLPMAMKASLLATSKTLRVVIQPVSKLVPHLKIFYEGVSYGLPASIGHFKNLFKVRQYKETTKYFTLLVKLLQGPFCQRDSSKLD